ncbi:MAG: pyridoxal phosphate-dependent aminotransferase [Euryarchaeota archaeon]|nr:pyridoxal phosphate-dependent aminotransferase [Euryarchaeota archaeon]
MRWTADTIKNAPPSVLEKLLGIAVEYEDLISLAIGEPDLDTPEYIIEAGKKALDEGYTHYTSNFGMIELRKAIAEKLERENNVTVAPDEVIVTCGAGTAIDLLMRAVLDPGDEVIVQDPGYFNYRYLSAFLNTKLVPVHAREENDFSISPRDVEEKITDRTKLLVINSPANPTGSVIPEKDLRKIADIAVENDIFVVSDEIYEKLIYDEDHFSITSIDGMKERSVLINGFSKAYAMTGWRIGYAAGNKEIINTMGMIGAYTSICAPGVSQKAAVAALKGDQSCIEKMRQEYDKRRRYIINRLNDVGIPTVMPKGAFYAFPNISEYGSSEEVWKLFLEKAGVAATPGTAFGEYGEGYLRFSYANSIGNIENALNNIEKVIKNV